MYPVFHIFGIHVSTYSLFMFIGVVAYVILFFILTKREKVERVSLNRMLFISVVGFIVLGVSALIFNSIFHSIERGEIVIGGITWLGGIIGLYPFMIFAFHKFVPQAKGQAVAYFSIVIPGIVLGHAFGRLGCFFGGCCYGKVTDSIFGVVFPEGSSAALTYPAEDGRSLPVYPTQLFEAAFEFVLFIVMMITRKKTGKYSAQIYMLSYGIFRFLIEFLRGDDRGSTGFFLSPAQFFCIIMLVFGVLMILFEKGIIGKKINLRRAAWQEQAKAAVASAKREEEETQSLSLLKQLYELKEQGVITENEFLEKKEQILKDI